VVGAGQLVANLFGLALGKRRVSAEPFLDIAAATLDEVGDEGLPVERLIGITIEAWIEQAEQRAKAPSIPLCGVAVTRRIWRLGSRVRSRSNSKR
jgi:hypothetical protein